MAKDKQKSENKKKRISLRGLVLIFFIGVITVSLVTMGLVNLVLSDKTNSEVQVLLLNGYIKSVSTNVTSFLDIYKTKATDLANEEEMIADLSNPKKLDEVLKQYATEHGLLSCDVVDKNGASLVSENNYSKDDYYIKFKSNKNTKDYNISSPIISKDKKQAYYNMFCPVEGTEYAVVISIGYDQMEKVVNGVTFASSGKMFMVDSKGYTIADKDQKYVLERENAFEEAKTNPGRVAYSNIVKDMVDRKTGNGEYFSSGKPKVVYYTPVENTDWSVAISAYRNDFESGLKKAQDTSFILLFVFIFLAVGVGIYISNLITKPIIKAGKKLKDVAEGNLEIQTENHAKSRELHALNESLFSTVSMLNKYISDIDIHLGLISKGVLTNEITDEYYGNFNEIKNSINDINSHLNDTIKDIKDVVRIINSSTNIVAENAQNLAQGTSEQAAIMEQIHSNIENINTFAISSDELAKKEAAVSEQNNQELVVGSTQMKELLQSMDKIKESSDKIHVIIKAINDIAFQTNILSLNASVEAARAGKEGKGFAVVADEIRDLAQKSTDAVNETTVLISDIADNVEKGCLIAGQTGQTIEKVVESSAIASQKIKEISRMCSEQKNAIGEVNTGINQVNIVVQENGAKSEEFSSTASDLKDQVKKLHDLTDIFKLK